MSRCNILFQNNIVTNLCFKKNKIKKKKKKKKKILQHSNYYVSLNLYLAI